MFTSQFKDNLTQGMPQVVSDSGQGSVQEAAAEQNWQEAPQTAAGAGQGSVQQATAEQNWQEAPQTAAGAGQGSVQQAAAEQNWQEAPQTAASAGQGSAQQTAESRLARKGYFYLGLSLFCLVLFLVYNLFSHGVHSPYMTYLFLWPLLMGAVPSFLAGLLPEAYLPGRHEWNLYFCGVEALTMASLLKGILDIAGTASVWQKYLMGAGSFLAIAGTLAWLARQKNS